MLFGAGDIRMRRMFIEQEESSEDRKRRERQRLAAMIGYCETPACRRRALLAYFGEEAQGCGNCDVCLNPVALSEATSDACLVVNAILQTGERYGAVHIVDILRGAETEKITAAQHDDLPAFGSGAARRKEDWRAIIRQMVGGGFLNQDVAGYGGLSVTEDGAAVLRGERPFLYRPDAAPPARKDRATAPAGEVTPEQSALLAELKKLRLRLATERHLPAYLIFSDKTLLDMARIAPRDLHQFAMVSGVGASKLRDFGKLFVDAIAAHMQAA